MQALRFLTDHLNDDVYYGAGMKAIIWCVQKTKASFYKTYRKEGSYLPNKICRKRRTRL